MNEKEYKEYVEYLNIIQHQGIDDDLFNSFVNDTIMKGITNFDVSRGVSIKSYMYKILENKIKYHFLRKKDIFFNNIEEYNFVDDIEGYDFEHDEHLKLLRKEIYKLPNKYKLICIFYFIDRIKTHEIAKVLEMNENTIKSRIHQAKKTITNNLC